jgi:hypothetical protein
MTWKASINTEAVKRAVLQAAADGLNDAAEIILNESDAHVPMDTGALENTGKVSAATVANLSATISYDTPYAVIQHEDMSRHHKPGRTAKYLENAMNSKRRAAKAAVTARVRDVVS